MILLVQIFAVFVISSALPLPRSKFVVNERFYNETKNWLTKYGYLDEPDDDYPITEHHFNRALYQMREFHQIPNIGSEYDEDFIKVLQMPRCGFPDTREGVEKFHMKVDRSDMNGTNKRRKRYAVEGSKWNKDEPLTYHFKQFTSDMSTLEQKAIFQRAVQTWTSVADIDLLETSSDDGDFDVLFAVGDHGDYNAFDGMGGTLAHAFYPDARLGGDIHFDDSEKFISTGSTGIPLYFVALHELGHSFGIGHSKNQDAIMLPTYRILDEDKLHLDDVAAIQNLYGVREGYHPASNSFNGIILNEGIVDKDSPSCKITFDAIVNTGEYIYIFKDDMVWETDLDFKPGDYAKKISLLWKRGPETVDAAFVKPDRSVVLLSGSRRWEYYSNSFELRPGFPKENSDLGDLPSSVDGAVYIDVFQIVLVFKDGLYSTLNPENLQIRSSGISVASLNIPPPINAVFYKDSQLYVLTDDTDFYVYNTSPFQQVSGYPKDFNKEIAAQLCAWCNTVNSSNSIQIRELNPWILLTVYLCLFSVGVYS
ncbi:macrophage metalloelastase-like [Apostichopus japonicus]|uniref:macrophage metalloelastase-like n=1 Tax=Stichopus japonicus TaxID=307972 RepID=UPI003AB3F541